jgi:peroxiredoxin
VSLKYNITYNVIPENTAPETEYIQFTSNFADLVSTGNVSTNFKALYSDFFRLTDSVYSKYTSNDPLFASFYSYFKANAYLTTDTSKTVLRNMYLHPDSTVDYFEYQYQKFVQAFFIPRIGHLFTTKKNQFDKAKKEYKIYESLVEQLQKDSLFSTKELASLGLLHFIRSSASNRHLNSDEKSAILGQIANFSEFPKQQSAARFFQKDSKKLQKNSEAPTFSLQDSNGEKVHLTDLRNQNVYLGFIHSQSKTCIQDLQVIENLAKKYRKMEFLLVLTDRDTILNTPLFPAMGNIHFVYLNKNYSVLEEYEIWSVPVYFLLDKHGYFLQSPSQRPGEMYPIFEQLFDKKRNGKGYEIILD